MRGKRNKNRFLKGKSGQRRIRKRSRKNTGTRPGANRVGKQRVATNNHVHTVMYNFSAAAVSGSANGQVVVNRSSVLSTFQSSPTAVATVTTPTLTAVSITGMRLIMPATTTGAAVIPTTIGFTFLSDDDDPVEVGYVNTGSASMTIDVLADASPESRIRKPSKTILPAAIEGPNAVQLLAENLFSIWTIGQSETDMILEVDFSGTLGMSTAPTAGGGAICTWSSAPGLIGNFFIPLDNLLSGGTGYTGYPTLSVGSWVLTPMLPAGQAITTKPTTFVRTVG